MMHLKRSRWAAVILMPMAIAACGLKDQLLEPQNPGIIDPSATTSPTAALALRNGAIGRYKQVMAGEGTWQMGGTLADEFKNSDFLTARINVDQRQNDNASDWGYTGITQSRGYVRDAIKAMKQYVPDSTALIGELYAELGFLELTLADNYCNGIPLGHTDAGVITNGVPLTTLQVYDSAIAHLDTALQIIGTATDVSALYGRRAALVFKARAHVMKGEYALAAPLVTAANIPTTYQYDMTFSTASGSNPVWSLANSTARISVADSFDIIAGSKNVIKNALPFASANDVRVPVQVGGVPPEDGVTPMFLSLIWRNQFDPMVFASGIDARLIEAEVALRAANYAGMTTILNTLRSTRPLSIGNYTLAAGTGQPALAVPATKAAAEALFFREKAFWTFGRGQRLADLRRMIRIYGYTQDQVFPTGQYFKGGVYGTDVNLPVPSREQSNPLFGACLDRNA